MFEGPKLDEFEKDIKQFVKQLKKREIYFFDVPEEYRLHPSVVKVERELGIRKSAQRGYDVIRNSFFVEEIVLTINYWDEEVEKQISNRFSDFASYYEFLAGDIYDNACYFQYNFSPKEIKSYNIDLNRINRTSLIDMTIKDFSVELTDAELQQYKTIERQKVFRKKWIAKFNACNTYEELKEVVNKFKKSKFSNSYAEADWLFFFYNFIFSNEDKAFDIIMQYVSNGAYPSYLIEKGLCSIYDPEKVFAAYNYSCGVPSTIRKHKRQFKQYIEQIQNKEVQFEYCSYFDERTHFFCHKVKGYSDKWQGYPGVIEIYRYFETIQELAEYLDNDLSGCDLSKAILPDIDLSIYKIDEYTKLPIQNLDNLTYTLYKGYDRKKQCFVVKQSWLGTNGQTIREQKNTFKYFFDFVFFLDNDLSDADLLFCNGLNNLCDFSNINFTNTKLKSEILDRIGIGYQLSAIDTKHVDTVLPVVKNEEETTHILDTIRTIHDIDRNQNEQIIYYISDLHLVHRVQNAFCKSDNDVLYVIQKIIDNMLYGARNIILIGGDTSSDFALFKLFVQLLRESLDEKKLDIKVIFLLGNHELWGFDGCSLEEIVQQYETVIKEQKMYLLQNDILYKDDDNKIYRITTDELISSSKEALREQIKTGRVILFGGLAFSGYNETFNANNGIYKFTIDRAHEILESKLFEKLYGVVCKNLSDKNIIVFTHTPQQDWCADNLQQSGFIYVNGHTHRNYFHDDGEYRIYADNQIGYHNENAHLKSFYLDGEYDWFSEYSDGIYEITKKDYLKFYRGKNITMQFTSDINILYMLKKNEYYCFIHQNKSKELTILNGAQRKRLDIKDVNYYYDRMDTVIAYIKTPLDKYTSVQKQIAKEVKAIGGSGKIHGAIIDIDFYNHIYVNPEDLTITGYWAWDMINKIVFPSIPRLLESKCPLLYDNYTKLLNDKTENALTLIRSEKELTNGAQVYLETNIYRASREIKKMQKLSANILGVWQELPKKSINKKSKKL